MAESSSGEAGGGYERSGRSGRPHSPIGESGLTAIKENRMLNRAIRNGWLKGQRWPTEATPSDLREKQARGELTLKEQAATACFLGLTVDIDAIKDDRMKMIAQRLRQAAVRNVVAMESQNQADDLAEMRAILASEGIGDQTSPEMLAAVLTEMGVLLAGDLGEDRAKRLIVQLQERITIDTTATGTTITPDDEARMMDSTIPAAPPDEETDE